MTSLYEEKLQKDLDTIRAHLKEVGDAVRSNLRHAVQAVVQRDRRLANETVIKDRAVNENLKELDHLCHLFVVRHLPSAGHLRFVSAVLRLSVALERTGDYATTISRVALGLSERPPGTVRRDLELMGEQAVKAIAVSMEAFLEGDVEKAKLGLGIASQVALSYRKAYEDLISAGEADRRPIRDLFGLLQALRLLNRAADQADNGCELTLFAVTGERKEAKRYRILFVDQQNAMLSKLAQVAAESSYEEAGKFASAGITPAGSRDYHAHRRRAEGAALGAHDRAGHQLGSAGPASVRSDGLLPQRRACGTRSDRSSFRRPGSRRAYPWLHRGTFWLTGANLPSKPKD